jgi:hypothetical protein
MKVSSVFCFAAIVGAVCYLMGTERGRQRRDDLVARIRKTASTAAESTSDSVSAAADVLADKAGALRN